MHKKPIIFTIFLFWGIISKANLLAVENSTAEYSVDHEINSKDVLDSATTDMLKAPVPDQYSKYINVQATEHMPDLSFELIGKIEEDDYNTNFYYPVKLVIKADTKIIQEIQFDEDDFAPCTLDTFDFEYGDFKFDGYGGFKILSTSMGKNPSYYFWIWDKTENSFIESQDLKIVGSISFDYDNQVINVTNRGSATGHEFTSYKYIDDKLTLIEKVIDPDKDGYRKTYKLVNGELELIETIESQLK